MRSATLKWMLLLLTLLVGVILVVQLYWISRVYYYEQKEFNTNVVKSIRGVCEDMKIDDNPGTQLQNLIEMRFQKVKPHSPRALRIHSRVKEKFRCGRHR